MWQHSYQIIQRGFSERWIKSLFAEERGRERERERKRERKSFSSQEQKKKKKDEMLISGGEHSAADSCFIMPLADTNTLLQSPSQKGFWWGRLTFRLKSRYLSIFSLTLKKENIHDLSADWIARPRAVGCELKCGFNLNEGGTKQRVYSTSVTHSTSERPDKMNFHAAPRWLVMSAVRSPGGGLWHKQLSACKHVNMSNTPGCPRCRNAQRKKKKKSCWMFSGEHTLSYIKNFI